MAVAFDTILQGAYSGIEDQVKSVIGDQDAWAELWARHNAILLPPPALPDLDFANEMIVCLYAGQQGSGGYTACIRSIEDSEDGRRVSFELGCPPPGAMCTDALTQPHHLVRMPRTTLPVSFREVVAPVEVATSATFLLTFDPAKKEEATQKVTGMPEVKDVKAMFGGDILSLKFDLSAMTAAEAQARLQGVEGVASVEKDG
ncbi:unnamed protein product [Effrenium voratum]|nr:unnamed protein product [Effrenium voratum]CAJ1343739.1 unnamed protein product [Effrenium voratum]